MKLRHIKKIVEQKTDKRIVQKERVVLYSNAIASFSNNTPSEYVLYGTIELVSELPMLLNHQATEGTITALALNKGIIQEGHKKYDNILFDELICPSISEDTEIVFYGYKFTLETI